MTYTFEDLKPYLLKRRKLGHLLSVLNYDLQTSCPKDGIEEEAELISDYSAEFASIAKDPDFIKIVLGIDPASLNARQKRLIESLREDIEFMEKVDMADYARWSKAEAKSNEMWRICKKSNDYATYLPYFEECVNAKKEQAKLRRKNEKTLYDVCLNRYEPGMTEEALNAVFEPLKKYLIEHLPIVMAKQEEHPLPKIKPYPIDLQRHLSYDLLPLIDYNLDRGCVRESAHPFSDSAGRYDARITTDYDINDFRGNLFSVIHEGGHCIQFQSWPKEHYDDFVEMSASMAMCETHSRLYENLLARDAALTPHLKALCAKDLDPAFATMSDADFHGLLNEVKPNLIRCDADEFTYSLHIIIRYEIERDLMNGVLSCKDIPAVWNAKYKEYLGIDVPTDTEGCLQDVHWSDGSIGYFPSYALGNLYGAQILRVMEKEIDVKGLLSQGNLKPIRAWLAEKDFAFDYLKPADWIVKVTGEKMNSQYFINYLDVKFVN